MRNAPRIASYGLKSAILRDMVRRVSHRRGKRAFSGYRQAMRPKGGKQAVSGYRQAVPDKARVQGICWPIVLPLFPLFSRHVHLLIFWDLKARESYGFPFYL